MKGLLAVLAGVVAAMAFGASLAGAGTGLLRAEGTALANVNLATLQVTNLPLGNQLLIGETVGPFHGTMEGTLFQHFVWHIFSNGNFVYKSTGTYVGTLGVCGSIEATFTAVVTGQLSPDGSLTFTGFNIGRTGDGTFYDIAVAGGGKFDGSPIPFTYSGRYRCA